jgi:hypothetical protein
MPVRGESRLAWVLFEASSGAALLRWLKPAPQPSRGVFGLRIEPGDPAIALPKFDIVAVDKLPCGLNRCTVIGAIKLDCPHEMPVLANDVNPIFGHLRHPCRS